MKTALHAASRASSSIEPLEARIAPAMVTLIANGASATYTDVDGDRVTVKVSTGTLAAGLFTGVAGASGDQLQLLDLSAGGFDGANLTFTVARVPGGDGLANVGYINSTGHDLGKVTVKGDLGQIDAGDATTLNDPGLVSLKVRSLGRLGTDTQAAGSFQSDINGALGALLVSGDVKGALVEVTGASDGEIGTIVIGGSLIGGTATDSGKIHTSGDIGPVKIGRDLQGGTGVQSGSITSGGKIASVTIGGSLLGGTSVLTGSISGNGDMGPVKIGQDMAGGSGSSSGHIFVNGDLARVSIVGSLIGSSGGSSGVITISGDMGAVKIAHNVQGGSAVVTGYIQATGKLASVTIGGSLIGGSNVSTGVISSIGDLGTIKIGHDVQGGSGIDAGYIHSGAKLAKVTVGGSLIGGSNIEAGKISSNGDMGSVKIGHDVRGGSGSNTGMIQSGGKLASVTIGGSLIGGSNTSTGEILSNKDIGAIKIGHDLVGGSVTGAASLDSSGLILSTGRIASVHIGGSIISGIDSSTGTLTHSGTINATNDLGAVTVRGSLIGHGDTGNGASPVVISARGQFVQGATTDFAIGRINVSGRVEYANLLAGYDFALNPQNGDAQIGAVKVGGDWAASNLVAGAKNLGADNAVGGVGANADTINFGDSHDLSIGAGTVGIIAKIASITIGGQVFGTPGSVSVTDHFGFLAAQIGVVKIAGTAIAHTANPQSVGGTTDVRIHTV